MRIGIRRRLATPPLGAGLTGEAVHFEHVIYEGFAPHRIPLMVECLTDNVNRTAPEMRVLFRKGQLGTSGSVSWDFDHVGMIEAEPTIGRDSKLSPKLGICRPILANQNVGETTSTEALTYSAWHRFDHTGSRKGSLLANTVRALKSNDGALPLLEL